MKLWLSKNSEIPMRDQLITQIKLGVMSGDLQIGEKLPSRGEIARRFDIHENTVSNAYKELAELGLINFKQGSGFYVCEVNNKNSDTETDLNSLTLNFLQNAQDLGYTIEEINQTIRQYLQIKTPKQILIIETDEQLREILIEEIRHATDAKISGISFEDFEKDLEHFEAVFVAFSDEEEKIQAVLPAEKHCIYLRSHSVPNAMQGKKRPEESDLIAIASGWDKFLIMAKTILVAAEIDADSIILRSTYEKKWFRGLENSAMVICDSLTASKIPYKKNIRPFPLIAEESINELRKVINNTN